MLSTEQREYDIEVELTLFTPENGGYAHELPSGSMHEHFFIDGTRWIARYNLLDREILYPGETARVFISFPYHPEALLGRLYSGKPFLLKNSTTIGEGIIIALLNFERHAELSKEHVNSTGENKPHIPPKWECPRRQPRKKKIE